ncbi:hypothetical protein SBOR_10108 [Sclerotinia borealis F-4128]|uniref:Uncharacterized protein n=1 Tax=Sclerotinia borealis (strain F-4128) TaxID=1432307 RepID=W9BY31_SCLBF|nr:hypothetical protein SBOR_10108 [Sclerotinia borealis F-4128]
MYDNENRERNKERTEEKKNENDENDEKKKKNDIGSIGIGANATNTFFWIITGPEYFLLTTFIGQCKEEYWDGAKGWMDGWKEGLGNGNGNGNGNGVGHLFKQYISSNGQGEFGKSQGLSRQAMNGKGRRFLHE